MIHLCFDSLMGRIQCLNSMSMPSIGTSYPQSKQVRYPKSQFFIIKQIYTMTSQNPYLLKNQRFRRNFPENEPTQTQVSIEKLKGQSSRFKNNKLICNRYIDSLLERSASKHSRRQPSQDKSRDISQEPKKIRRKNQQTQKEHEWREHYQQLQNQLEIKNKHIAELQRTISVLSQENKKLTIQLKEKEQVQGELRIKAAAAETNYKKIQQQVDQVTMRYEEEVFQLRKALKHIEIEVGCVNKKWTINYQQLKKEKDIQYKKLRVQFTNLIKRNRSQTKLNTLLSTGTSSISSSKLLRVPWKNQTGNQQSSLSSFQLSKDS